MARTIASLGVLLSLTGAVTGAPPIVVESARQIPLAYDVDVVVVGGSSGGVAAAQAAAAKGAKVFLAAPRAYLGDDIAGCMRLWLADGERPQTDLAKAIFADAGLVRPAHVKAMLDKALLDAGAQFLTGCYGAEPLRDEQGGLAGITIANRAGRQAVRAKLIIDATERASVARQARAQFSVYDAGPQKFTRITIGGQAAKGEGVVARALPGKIDGPGGGKGAKLAYTAWEYTLTLPMKDGEWPSFAEAEQAARDKTWDADMVDSADSLFHIPPDAMTGQATHRGAWPGADKVDLKAFRPGSVERLWVIGPCADVSRQAAARMLAPCEFLALGQRIGQAAAAEAAALPVPRKVNLPGTPSAVAGKAQVREALSGLRPTTAPSVAIDAQPRAIPVLGEYDVVVVGGGTGGAPAGIGAARQGARTLVAEYLHGLGGVSTLGMIGKYYHGNRVGFTTEHDNALGSLGAAVRVVGKAELFRRDNRSAGGHIWLGVMGCGALVEDGKVKGVVVATPAGRGVVLAKSVVDATGNSDIAAPAGAQCMYTDAQEIAVQGTGLPVRSLGVSYANNDYTFADDTDPVDLWWHFVAARSGKTAWDIGQIVNTRERRRIVGDVVLSPLDLVNQRTFPDTITVCKSNFDSHGYTIHPFFWLVPPSHAGLTANLPYRCLAPKGLDGILVTGLAVSAHRDAIPVVRMQPDIQNEGYAAGVAAAMAAKAGGSTRNVDIRALQKHLVEKEILPPAVLEAQDSYPLPPAQLAAAVDDAADNYKGIALILVEPDRSLPLLRAAYAKAATEASKLIYAHILGMLGDPAGAATLRQAVESTAWDKGWNFRGMGQYGASVSKLDSYIIALGRTRDQAAAAVLVKKLAQLTDASEFSHFRAIALALESIGDKSAATPLARMLGAQGMTGHWAHSLADAAKMGARSQSLREIALARALFRLGDHEGVGRKVLQEYEKDYRGHYARHAHAVLSGDTKGDTAPY